MKQLNTILGCFATMFIIGCSTPPKEETSMWVQPSKLDVESFIDTVDISMDIDELSLSDCRILQNAFAARVGFPFRDAYIRGIYQTTTWYDSLQWIFWDDERYIKEVEPIEGEPWRDEFYRSVRDDAIKLTPEQRDFIERLKVREAELMKHNFDVPEGFRVNIGNLANPAQLIQFDTLLQRQLAQNGFAIVPADHQQLFHVYEKNDYANMPNFVTTDLYLQLFHLYIDCMLRDVEEHRLMPQLRKFCDVAASYYMDNDETSLWIATYFKVANALLRGTAPEYDAKTLEPYKKYDAAALDEYNKVMKSADDFSDYLGYNDVKFAYSLFRPRGHYTRNDTLQRYFRTMMWLQTVPFRTDSKQDMRRVLSLAGKVGNPNYDEIYQLYKNLTEPITFLMGKPDDVSILQAGDIVNEFDQRLFYEKIDSLVDVMTRRIDEIAEKQTRLRPKFTSTGRNKVRLMPQRYQPDAEVLQEMVDYDNTPTQRALPQGLDVMAAMGVTTAESILKEKGQRWKGFEPALKRMKARMESIDWDETVTNGWLKALKTVNDVDDDAPYFMLTPEWQHKSLNTALASWAELKHDAILYAKQPMGAECGGGGPPEPVVTAYVEPNTEFWEEAIELLDDTEQLLKHYGLLTEKIKNATNTLREQAQFLLRVSEKELKGEMLSDNEYDQLKCIGAVFENISLDLIREPNQYLMGWDDVQGPDRNTALVADVYTANADNNPEKSILYAAVGQADEIYVIVEVGGYLRLMRGAVLSYREFKRPLNQQRLNDEEWQQYLKGHPREGVPQWMDRILVPLKKNPMPNEKFFYSTGC